MIIRRIFYERQWQSLAFFGVMLAGLYLTTFYSYLLFHSLAETFRIVIAFGIFMIAWHSRKFQDNTYLLFLGTAYLFIGFLDLFHTLAYKGMNVFPSHGPDLPTQFWVAARYMESLSFLIAPFFIKRNFRAFRLFYIYLGITLLLFISIMPLGIFPACFTEGEGLTLFKHISEYIVSFFFLTAIALLYKKKAAFDPHMFRLLVVSLGIAIAAELFFTFYIDVYGLSNMVGHFFKIVSCYLIYEAIIKTSLEKPYDFLFRDLKQREAELEVRKNKEALSKKVESIFAELGHALISEEGIDTITERILRAGQTLTDSTKGFVGYIDRETGYFHVPTMTSGIWEECRLENRTAVFRKFSGIIGWVQDNRQPVFINDVARDSRSGGVPEGHIPIRRFISAPALYRGELVGQVAFANADRDYSERDLNIVNRLSTLLASLIVRTRDAAEREKAEAALKSSLKEKEILLRELYHRTKNNMMVIMSMLDIQTRNITDENVLQIFRETNARIKSMALVHEKLYQGQDLSRVDLKEYFTDLVSILKQSYGVGNAVGITSDMTSLRVSIDSAVPCGLIVNELISNAFKHAFPGGRTGEIRVTLREHDEKIEFGVSDNGIGLPRGFDWRSTGSYGLQSAVSLAEHQLGGRFMVDTADGVAVTVRFHEPEDKIRV